MKKLFMILGVLAVFGALGSLPFRGTDVAELLPVRTVLITRSGTEYAVDIGAGVRAVGKTLHDALTALREEAGGEVFFNTAEQVIVSDTAAETVDEVVEQPELRPAAGIWLTPVAGLDVQAAGEYLSAHEASTTIMEVRARLRAGQSPRIPWLVPSDGGFRVYA